MTLESLARTAVGVPIAAGDVVISEGDAADALFVISAGQFVVSPVGRTLGTDDYFGEIGVLEGVPRTATVTATTDGTLYRIAANDFVAALNEAATGMRHLAGTLSARLARTHSNRPANFTGRGQRCCECFVRVAHCHRVVAHRTQLRATSDSRLSSS